MAVDTHLICGAHDWVTPIDPWREMAATNPLLHLHTIADAGHCPMIETPEAFNAVLQRLLVKERATSSSVASLEARPAP